MKRLIASIALLMTLTACDEMQMAAKMTGNYRADSSSACGQIQTAQLKLEEQHFDIYLNEEKYAEESYDLTNINRIYDCTPHASYSPVECRNVFRNNSFYTQNRGCLWGNVICGPWHNGNQITYVDPNHIAINECMFTRTTDSLR